MIVPGGRLYRIKRNIANWHVKNWKRKTLISFLTSDALKWNPKHSFFRVEIGTWHVRLVQSVIVSGHRGAGVRERDMHPNIVNHGDTFTWTGELIMSRQCWMLMLSNIIECCIFLRIQRKNICWLRVWENKYSPAAVTKTMCPCLMRVCCVWHRRHHADEAALQGQGGLLQLLPDPVYVPLYITITGEPTGNR